MNKAVALNNASDICLANHGVIEAHAGTGKTYTIVKMVLRILEKTVKSERNSEHYHIHIREILLVTYTEKAAGELKRRIREGIENRINELRLEKSIAYDALIVHLENCLNNLHEALIGTIHSICLRLLQTWPFETGIHFATEVVDDKEGLEHVLRELMRTVWQDTNTHIPWALGELESHGDQLSKKHFGLIQDTALHILDKDNTILDRSHVDNLSLSHMITAFDSLQKSIADLEQDFNSCLKKLVDSLGDARDCGEMDEDRLALLKIRLPALERIHYSHRYDLKVLEKPCTVGRTGIYTKAHLNKIPALAAVSACADDVSQHDFVSTLKKVETLHRKLKTVLICDAAQRLADRWNRVKSEKGLISYQDMLRLMHKAVFSHIQFLNSMRKKLKYGIIDEFQDTSILQWQIFRRIFLDSSESDSPRIFIVGDPKQSIYSFQGADVQSYLYAKEAIVKRGGTVYNLINNFRSLQETLDGYNAVFGRQEEPCKDWFQLETADRDSKISYPSEGEGGALAKPPEQREARPGQSLPWSPVQVMVLQGNAPKRRREMAQWTGKVIQSLYGTMISIPDGLKWKKLTLDYKDFAVVVEAHHLADPFLEQFRTDGIPAVKYKMEGVFQSSLARDLHALLRAILNKEGDPAPRLAALLTHFFNRSPEQIDPERDLEPCTRLSDCRNGQPCLSHSLDEWIYLADRKLWAQLFNSIQKRTRVRELLIRLIDGQRHLSDLQQVIDYCLEKLYHDNYNLQRLVEHLGMLLSEKERVGQDKNLYQLATDKSSVKVLTMHAAKGLEFPIVFVVTGGSRGTPGGPNTLTWIDKDHKKHVLPYLHKIDVNSIVSDTPTPLNKMIIQETQERRRLLYVALTRAQAMAFVPMHLQKIARDKRGKEDWDKCSGKPFLPHSADMDLTPRLCQLLGRGEERISLFSEDIWDTQKRKIGKDLTVKTETTPILNIPDINMLDLPSRISLQTSYSQLSRNESHDRAVDRSEEIDEEEGKSAIPRSLPPTVLPGGKHTGDALHLTLEQILLGEKIKDDITLKEIVGKNLINNGVFKYVADENQQAQATLLGAELIKNALTTGFILPDGQKIVIGNLPQADRVPEMEFQLAVDRHWVHGFMDLVFRIPIDNKKHPWRYYVLDWKSDRLEQFDRNTITECIEERHYSLQAKIYCHALDKYLTGLLGDAYDPDKNLGGALYVFLRSFEGGAGQGDEHLWARRATPAEDLKFTSEHIRGMVTWK